MRDDDAADPPRILFQLGKIGVNDVDAKHTVIKSDPTIDHQNLAIDLDGETVHSDLTEAPKR
jgi:hypothetical protein